MFLCNFFDDPHIFFVDCRFSCWNGSRPITICCWALDWTCLHLSISLGFRGKSVEKNEVCNFWRIDWNMPIIFGDFAGLALMTTESLRLCLALGALESSQKQFWISAKEVPILLNCFWLVLLGSCFAESSTSKKLSQQNKSMFHSKWWCFCRIFCVSKIQGQTQRGACLGLLRGHGWLLAPLLFFWKREGLPAPKEKPHLPKNSEVVVWCLKQFFNSSFFCCLKLL